VKLVSTLPFRSDQACCFKNLQMLRYTLPRHADLVLHQQASAELEERLPIPLAKFIQNRPAHRRRNCFEDIAHVCFFIRK
jgi:hypothetical protein